MYNEKSYTKLGIILSYNTFFDLNQKKYLFCKKCNPKS